MRPASADRCLPSMQAHYAAEVPAAEIEALRAPEVDSIATLRRAAIHAAAAYVHREAPRIRPAVRRRHRASVRRALTDRHRDHHLTAG